MEFIEAEDRIRAPWAGPPRVKSISGVPHAVAQIACFSGKSRPVPQLAHPRQAGRERPLHPNIQAMAATLSAGSACPSVAAGCLAGIGRESAGAAAGRAVEVGFDAALPQVQGYEMMKILGRGGMGVVYLARQVGLKRLVALKMILHGDYADREQKKRFRPGSGGRGPAHPTICGSDEVGEHQGQPYFAMEYCDGGTLQTWIKEGPLSPMERNSPRY